MQSGADGSPGKRLLGGDGENKVESAHSDNK